MSIFYKNIKVIVIVLLIGIIVLIRACQPKSIDETEYIRIGGKKYELLSKTVDTTYIKVTDTITEYVPKYITRIETEFVEIPADIDTLEILKDYYTKYAVNDTIPVNEYGIGIITDTITQNKIISRRIEWDLDIPIVKETITVKQLPKNQLYIGAGVGFDKVIFVNQVNAGLLFKTKTDKIYGLNVGLTNTNFDLENNNGKLTPYVGVSMYWKIRLGKK